MADDALDLLTRGLYSSTGLSLTTRGLVLEAEEADEAGTATGLSTRQPTDAKLSFDRDTLAADVELDRGQLVADHGLETAVLVSLFTDRLADEIDALPLGVRSRRGWWGDIVPPAPGDKIGSRLWLLSRERQTQETRLKAREFTEEALAWLVEDGVASRVDVEAEWLRRGVLALGVAIHRPEQQSARFRFAIAWEGV